VFSLAAEDRVGTATAPAAKSSGIAVGLVAKLSNAQVADMVEGVTQVETASDSSCACAKWPQPSRHSFDSDSSRNTIAAFRDNGGMT